MVALSVILLAVTGCATPVSTGASGTACADPIVTTRHELFFGLQKPDSSIVSEGEFAAFMRDIVRPRFPDGATLISADGQYQLADGTRIEEPTKILVLIYPDSAEIREKIGEVITQFRERFRQESVGWVRTTARVCF